MAPHGALTQAWVSAEAAMPLGWHTSGLWRFGELWVALAEGPEFDDYLSGTGQYADQALRRLSEPPAGAAGTGDGVGWLAQPFGSAVVEEQDAPRGRKGTASPGQGGDPMYLPHRMTLDEWVSRNPHHVPGSDWYEYTKARIRVRDEVRNEPVRWLDRRHDTVGRCSGRFHGTVTNRAVLVQLCILAAAIAAVLLLIASRS